MPRKPTALGARAEKKIAALVARGGTAESIAKALRAAGVKNVSVRTIGRRMRDLRGDVLPKRVSATAAQRAKYATPDESEEAPKSGPDRPLPESPEAIPEETDLAQIERWLKRAEVMARKAVTLGDLAAIGQMGRLTSALLEAKRKATPLEKDDPSDAPDMQKLAQQVEIRLLKYVDDIVGGT